MFVVLMNSVVLLDFTNCLLLFHYLITFILFISRHPLGLAIFKCREFLRSRVRVYWNPRAFLRSREFLRSRVGFHSNACKNCVPGSAIFGENPGSVRKLFRVRLRCAM